MNFKQLHEQFKDNDSPSVEGQIRWLQKQGFAQHQIEQAMLTVYSELERGETPLVFTKKEIHPDGGVKLSRVFGNNIDARPDESWNQRVIVTGEELDKYLQQVAKRVRTEELTLMVKNMEAFEDTLRKKWMADLKAKEAAAQEQTKPVKKKAWWRR